MADKKNKGKKLNTIHIHFVLDRSGSMSSIRSDVIGGFNTFLKEQKGNPGKCLLTFIQFDTTDAYEIIHNAVDIKEVSPLTEETFAPRSGTPLYDAMGHAIADADIRAEKLEREEKQAEKILFVTFTDGQENSSREYTKEMVFTAIKARKEEGWTFVYLGANQDAYAESSKVGYSVQSTNNFDATPLGTVKAFRTPSSSTSSYRMRGGVESNSDFFEQTDKLQDSKERSSNHAVKTP